MAEKPMPPLPANLPERVRAVIESQIRFLRSLTEDKPAHATWLEECIAYEFDNEGTQSLPNQYGRKGLSKRAGDVIDEEVTYLARLSRLPDSQYVSKPELTYAEMRRRDRARGARRRKDPLQDLLQF